MLLPSILAGFSMTAMSPSIWAKIIQNVFALLNMCHLTASETQCNLYFVTFTDELLSIIHFGIKIIRLNIW